MACLTDMCLISWIGFECVVTDCFGCNDGTWTGCCMYVSTGTPMCNDTAGVTSTGNNIKLANACAFAFTQNDDMSIAVWTKTSVNSEQGLVTKTPELAGGVNGWYLKNTICGMCRIQFAFSNACAGLGRVFADFCGFSDNTWHHIVFTKPADMCLNNMKLYFDGVLACTCAFGPMPGVIPNDCIPITIGAESDDGRFFTGCIDEVSIWQRELTAGDVARLYNAGSGLKYVDLPFEFPSTIAPTKFISSADTTKSINRS